MRDDHDWARGIIAAMLFFTMLMLMIGVAIEYPVAVGFGLVFSGGVMLGRYFASFNAAPDEERG